VPVLPAPPPPSQKAEKVTTGTCVVYSYAALALVLRSELSLCVHDVTSSLPWQRVARLTDYAHSSPVIAPFVTPMIVGVFIHTHNAVYRSCCRLLVGDTV
jgi:hypothetical protein